MYMIELEYPIQPESMDDYLALACTVSKILDDSFIFDRRERMLRVNEFLQSGNWDCLMR